ncbi:DUF2997 domain-containing protein [Crocosphaera sp. UHCC 0190]|uniref:DUF2997 domain-containing protein n=1 Tax=Crocosphaera sp. UHCC 0190 TaxID=3110246 RepID=UPI002B213F5E|nr:DUF2997 domain-containing protein [Crocosphaera sp. UHCC 0190]MEA5512247.1 DUF2997 domain-containing protein [Crocosphaera sp. UHCC 0190]
MSEQITITVDQNGNFTLEVNGAKGDNCLSLTKPLEEALGGIEQREFKPEYRQSSHQINQQHLSN